MSQELSRSGRRAEQRRAERRSRLRSLAILLTLLALVAGGFAVYLAVDAPEPPAPQNISTARTQRVLLLQVQGVRGLGDSHVLLAHDETAGGGAAVLIAPQLLVNVPGTGSLPLGKALVGVPPASVRDAVSDLLGVTIDDGWVLDRPALVQLVDGIGGIEVDVDVQVAQGQSVLLSPGEQLLDGAQAGVFSSYLAPGEQEQSRLARVQGVLDGVLQALPDTAAEVTTVLEALGPRSVTTAPPAALAGFLVGLAAADAAGRLQYDVLPVVDVDPGGETVFFRADTAPLTALVDRLLAASVREGVREGGNRVLVLNGVGTPGLGDAVRARLVPAGFVFVGSDNAPRFGYATTLVLVPDRTAAGQALGERVAKALGVPGAQVGTQDIGTGADVVVIVGADFTP